MKITILPGALLLFLALCSASIASAQFANSGQRPDRDSLLILVSSVEAGTVLVGQARFEEGLACNLTPGCVAYGTSLILPEIINLDVATTNCISENCFFVGQAITTGGQSPMADLQLAVNDANGTGLARVDYQYQLVARDPNAPTDVPIPVAVSSVGEASVTSTGDNYVLTSRVTIAGTAVPGVGFVNAEACLSSDPAQCVGFGPFASLNVSYTEQLDLTTNSLGGVRIEAYSGVLGSGESQAVIDPIIQIDSNFTVNDSPATELYELVFSPGISPLDSDFDGIPNSNDNCTNVANSDQRDTDFDNIGNSCDPDVAVPNDCIINFLDLNIYKANFFAPGDLDTDNNGDGQTNFLDLNVVKSFFFGPPGPSAVGCN